MTKKVHEIRSLSLFILRDVIENTQQQKYLI